MPEKKTKKEVDETPKAFVGDMLGTARKHWKFFLGFALGALIMFYLLP